VSEHRHAAAARQGFEDFRRGDVQGLLALFAPDAVWHVPGDNAMTGAYRGMEEIGPFLRRTAELTGGTYHVDLLWAVSDDEHLVAVYRARGERPDGRTLDVEQALLIDVGPDGRWTTVRAQPLDERAFDAFWT
jgi:ketosteroid isomerase-like protein